jgi:outer membrane protein TolC
MKYLYTLTIFGISISCLGQPRSLEQYIQIAKENNATLKGFQNQILANQLDSQILNATTKTQVNFLSNDLYAPVIHGWGYDPAITNIAQVSALVQATKNYISQQNLAAQYRAIALQSQALRDSIRLSIKDLVRAITDQYITAYGDQLTMDYTNELYNLLKNEEEALKKLAQASVIKQTEFLAFTITMQQQELTYLQAKIQFNTDYLTLNYLAGLVDTTISRLEEPKLVDSIPHDFYTSAFYQKYITDSLRIINERVLIRQTYRPTIGALADAGYNSSMQVAPYRNFGYSFGVNIKMPIYDAHQRKMRYQKLDLEERTRLINKNFFINQYNQQVALLTIQLHGTDELFQKISQQVNYTKTLIIAYEKLLETSDVKITDFVTAVTNYLNAQNTFRQNLISRLKIMSQLNYWNQ